MNLFSLDNDPALAAQGHCDQHLCKMILETAQIMDGGTRALASMHAPDLPLEIVKIPVSHSKNPVILSAKHRPVFDYCSGLLQGLLAEFRHRYGHEHGYAPTGVSEALATRLDRVGRFMTPGLFYIAVADALRPGGRRIHGNLDVAVELHRRNYVLTKMRYGKRFRPVTWRDRIPPDWMIDAARAAGYFLQCYPDGRFYFQGDPHAA